WTVMIVTGVLLFWSEPQKLYYSTPFAVKMVCLLLGTIFALTVRRKATLAGEGRVSPVALKLVALVSLILWFGVGAGGRWIGFSGERSRGGGDWMGFEQGKGGKAFLDFL